MRPSLTTAIETLGAPLSASALSTAASILAVAAGGSCATRWLANMMRTSARKLGDMHPNLAELLVPQGHHRSLFGWPGSRPYNRRDRHRQQQTRHRAERQRIGGRHFEQ